MGKYFKGASAAEMNLATGMAEITPNNSTVLDPVPFALYIEVAGDLAVVTQRGDAVTIPVPNNFILHVACKQVKSTGTTATGIYGYYFD